MRYLEFCQTVFFEVVAPGPRARERRVGWRVWSGGCEKEGEETLVGRHQPTT